jgi:hypothetical protein
MYREIVLGVAKDKSRYATNAEARKVWDEMESEISALRGQGIIFDSINEVPDAVDVDRLNKVEESRTASGPPPGMVRSNVAFYLPSQPRDDHGRWTEGGGGGGDIGRIDSTTTPGVRTKDWQSRTGGTFKFEDTISRSVRNSTKDAVSAMEKSGLSFDGITVTFGMKDEGRGTFASTYHSSAHDWRIETTRIMDDKGALQQSLSKAWGQQGQGFSEMYSRNDVGALRETVMIHELGHVQTGRYFEQSNEIASKQVTPRSVGFTITDAYDSGRDLSLDAPVPRWTVDSLKEKGVATSSYSNSQPWEWAAEALTNGVLHGANASDGGKEMLAAMRAAGGGSR